jgi:para-aminobenzoate synthetase component 1
MRVVPLALRRDPWDALASLAEEPGAFLFPVPDPLRPVTLLGCAPAAWLHVYADGTVARSDGRPAPADPLAAIEAFVGEARSDALPFPLGATVVGYLAYELGRVIEPPRAGFGPPAALPLAVLARYDALLAHERGQYTLVTRAGTARPAWLERLAASARRPPWEGQLATAPLAPVQPRARYLAAVRRILEYLAAGDAYQVNLTQPFVAPLAAPPWVLAARLAACHPVPYAGYLDVGAARLVSNSPELFLRRRGSRIETRPIKGTRPRGDGPARDAALAAELARDPKECAEHVMIVDLERNDLGRVATVGSVAVERLAALESHGTVHHLVSTVSGRVPPAIGLAALLRATFPGGSITGAPKVRAMEIIRELEPWPRGPYTGAFGLFHPDGDLELALAIRTAIVHGGTLRYHAGGGIVADSDPEAELAECWLKTAALRLALGEVTRPDLEQCSSG